MELETPPDPASGSTVLELDALDFVHAVCQQIPDKGMHLVRYYGAYANRKRRALREARAALAGHEAPAEREDRGARDTLAPARPGSAEALRRQAWARMIKKVFEVDPLVCPRCRVEMTVVAYITEPIVIDRILAHRRQHGLCSPFDANPPRAPPAA